MILNLKVVKIQYKVIPAKNNKNTIRFEADGIRLPKIGVLRAKNKLKPQGRILSATLRREDDKYYVSLLFTDTKIKTYEDSDKEIGIDVGIKNTVTTSNGETYNIPPKVYKLQKQISKLQKKNVPTEKGWKKLSTNKKTPKKKIQKNTQYHRKFHAPHIIKNYKRKPDNIHRNTQHQEHDAKPQTSKKYTNTMLELTIYQTKI